MPLHPAAQEFLKQLEMNSANMPAHMDAIQMRNMSEPYMNMMSEKYELAQVEDCKIDGPYGQIPLRIYRPDRLSNQPVLVFFHGGGFVMGSVNSYSPFCEKLAHYTRCNVVSVDYRLSPEARFPVAPDEACTAVKWVYDHARELDFDRSRFGLMGDSAGGNLVAGLAQRLRDQGEIAVSLQVLLYPRTDFVLQTPSMELFGHGYFGTLEMDNFLADCYFAEGEDRSNPLASPLRGALRNLPPAFILTAEYDTLRDEGELYAEKLKEAGVEVRLKRYSGMIHAFASFTDMFGNEPFEDISSFIQKYFFQ